MRVIVHLSDLHFGRIADDVIEPLIALVQSIGPHITVVSGDLTQRARTSEFIAARRFLDRLPKPQIVVPGNHDVPLHDVLGRFFSPLTKYRRYVTDDLAPFFVDAELAVVGINTARSLTMKGGRVNDDQVALAHARLAPLSSDITKIVVTHHPFDVPAGHGPGNLIGGARDAMMTFAKAGADILLAGHLHITRTVTTAERYEIAGHAALVVQAGTATSTRVRGETNSFNVIRVHSTAGAGEASRVDVERHSWDEARRAFVVAGLERFSRRGGVWSALPT